MKQHWQPAELINDWTLTAEEETLVNTLGKKDGNRLGGALLLKYFQTEGRFPARKEAIPKVIVQHVAQRLRVSVRSWQRYELEKRSARRHRERIRGFLGARMSTVADAHAVAEWLAAQIPLLDEHNSDRITAIVYDRYKELKLEPPQAGQVERLVRSVIKTADAHFFTGTSSRLQPKARQQLDALPTVDAATGQPVSPLFTIKSDTGATTLENVLAEVEKLERINALGLPAELFAGVSRKRLLWCKQRIAVEELHEIRRHPEAIRYSLLAAFCHERRQEIVDTLIELLIGIIHKIGSRAERRVNKAVVREVKRVQGKGRLLYEVAVASLGNPDGKVKETIFPVADEQTLREIIQEFKANGTYDQRVQTVMRGSYSNHYRRMVPVLLSALDFGATSEASRPVLAAIGLIRKYAEKNQAAYPAAETVPLEGIVPEKWLPLVQQGQRINRIGYELCVLRTVRDKIRCKELYTPGAYRYRNPDEDLPQDFGAKREEYFKDLKLPLSADAFIAQEQEAMKAALARLNKGFPQNKKVTITKKNGKPWIKVAPLDPLPEPKNLAALKAEVGKRWPQIFLLDMLKEADLRTGFTDLFKSPTPHETLPREILQIRLLLCLYALGTNAGIKRVASGTQSESFRDLFYVLKRFISRDGLRAAIAEIANAVLRERDITIWGEATSLASDAKKFCAWDQNLMTEWHIRYRGPGIMIYWHVEKKSLCVYSQIRRCSSSEVAAMIEGVLRHCTEMEVEKNYIDSHGQDEAAFAFCHLLGFRLLPRLKGIGRQKLYRPEAGDPQAYKHLQDVLTRPIDWELIREHYDEIVKYATALKRGTADAEAILSRFRRSGLMHPVFKALLELGKVRKTIFLCEYLHSEALRQEIEGGLNVIENWNSTNDFIWYGKGGEIATNNREEQEIAILSLHLLQICMVYINTLLVQKVLAEPEWLDRMQPEDFWGLNPLFYFNINSYGRQVLNMQERLIIWG